MGMTTIISSSYTGQMKPRSKMAMSFAYLVLCVMLCLSGITGELQHPLSSASTDKQMMAIKFASLKSALQERRLEEVFSEGDLPTSQPSTYPTSQPSAWPTAEPTSQPTSAPTSQPSLQPAALPTTAPSQFSSAPPTEQPTSQPTSMPSSQPTSQPSAHSTASPTHQPSRQPSNRPTSQPSRQPSSQPSADPTGSPTSMPSPQGSLDVTWWYLVTARCELGATSFRSYTADEILDAVKYAFSFVLTDALDEVEREGVEVAVTAVSETSASVRAQYEYVGVTAAATRTVSVTTMKQEMHSGTSRDPSMVRPARARARALAQIRPLESEQRAYEVSAWCPDHPTANKVYQAMAHVSAVPLEVIEPLHEKGLYDVVNVTVSNIALTTTTQPPPSLGEDELSPVRITWIIVGTLIVFAVALFLLSRMRYLKYLCCTKTCVEDLARSWYNTLADGCMLCLRSIGLVSSDLRLYYGSGFDLTTQEEEADFYGENRGNLPSDNLDIHYGGDNKTLRSKYLEDDEDAGHEKKGLFRGALGRLVGLRSSRSSAASARNPTGAGAAGQGSQRPPAQPPRSVEMRRWSDNDVISPMSTGRGGSDSPGISAAGGLVPAYGSPNRLVHSASARPLYRPAPAPAASRPVTVAYGVLSDHIDDVRGFSRSSPLVASAADDLDDSYESFVV